MAFSPAWGGLIPLVPIGSFRGFLGQRQKGRNLRLWYTGTITRAVVASALKTQAGRRAAENISSLLRAMGVEVRMTQIGPHLEAYIAFQKFQHRQAVQRKNVAAQRSIEAVMFAPGGRIVTSGRKPAGQLIPAEYFKMLAVRQPPGPRGGVTGPRLRPEDVEGPALVAFASWFDRRRHIKGRFKNA